MIQAVGLRISRAIHLRVTARATRLIRGECHRMIADRMPAARRSAAKHNDERDSCHGSNMSSPRIHADKKIQLLIKCRKLHEIRLSAEIFNGKSDCCNHFFGIAVVAWRTRHIERSIIARMKCTNDLHKVFLRPCLQPERPLDTEPDLSLLPRGRKNFCHFCLLLCCRTWQNRALMSRHPREAANDLLIRLRLQRIIEIMSNRNGMCIEPCHATRLIVKDTGRANPDRNARQPAKERRPQFTVKRNCKIKFSCA